MMRKWIVCIAVFVLPAALSAQSPAEKNSVDFAQMLTQGTGYAKSLMGMVGLDPNRLHVSHSYSMAFMNAGGHSLSQGVYLNTLHYQFNSPLTLSLQWGVAHNPLQNSAVAGAGNVYPVLQSGPFVSSARLEYKPKGNMTIGLEYSSNPYGYGYGYRNPYANRGFVRTE